MQRRKYYFSAAHEQQRIRFARDVDEIHAISFPIVSPLVFREKIYTSFILAVIAPSWKRFANRCELRRSVLETE